MALERATVQEMDLTPLADMVFNLLIFFVLVAEIGGLDVEKMNLPFASQANKPEGGQRVNKLLIFNVIQPAQESTEATIRFRGKALAGDTLTNMLRLEALSAPTEKDKESGLELSTLEVLIRGDADIQYGYVQKVMMLCMKEKIWKTSVGALKQ